MTTLLLLAAGLALLMAGGDMLVRGAAASARHFGVSPLLTGLTIVAFGTSTPELVTSVQAAWSGSPAIAFGNIVGSNIANILLILGLSALIFPLPVARRALTRDSMFMLAAAALFAVAGLLLPFGRMIGFVFLALLTGYIIVAYRQEARSGVEGHSAAFEKAEAFEELHPGETSRRGRWALHVSLAMTAAGLALVIGGGKLLVESAVVLAREAGVSERVIGLTIVAVGTSLPELVTSVLAAIRRHGDVALGNVLGSNIYNILGIAGATAAIAPSSIPAEILRLDVPVMVAISALCVVFAATGMRIGRREGFILTAAYGLYLFAIIPR